jgi:hypothetical protein
MTPRILGKTIPKFSHKFSLPRLQGLQSSVVGVRTDAKEIAERNRLRTLIKLKMLPT